MLGGDLCNQDSDHERRLHTAEVAGSNPASPTATQPVALPQKLWLCVKVTSFLSVAQAGLP